MNLSIREELVPREKGGTRVLERIGQTESKDETAGDGKGSHKSKQPEPSRLASDTSHMEDTIGEKFGRSLSQLVAKVENHDTFRGLLASVPGRQRPETTRNVAGFSYSEKESCGNKRPVALHERLEGTDDTKQEQLQSEPFSRADPVERHVCRYFEEDDTQREHLLANIKLVLRDANIFPEIVREGVGNVASVEF